MVTPSGIYMVMYSNSVCVCITSRIVLFNVQCVLYA